MTMESNDAIEAAHAFRRSALVAVHNHGRKVRVISPPPSPRSASLTNLESGKPTRLAF
jgi:hypothetical protein